MMSSTSLRHFASGAVSRCGGHHLARYLTAQVPRVLMFHRFSTQPAWRKTSLDQLRTVLDHVERRHKAVTLDRIVENVIQRRRVPEEVALTVDDAYEDFYRIALPEFEARRLPVALYVPTDFVDQRSWLWPDRLLYLIRTSVAERADLGRLGVFPLRTLGERRLAWNVIGDRLVDMSSAERERCLGLLQASLDCVIPERATADYQPMNWDQLRDACRRGVCIASQAGAHIPLSREKPETQVEEARRSRARLESELQVPVRHFSYPHGRRSDFDKYTIAAAATAGYVSSAAAVPGVTNPDDPFQLPRLSVPANASDLPALMSGWSQLVAWAARA